MGAPNRLLFLCALYAASNVLHQVMSMDSPTLRSSGHETVTFKGNEKGAIATTSENKDIIHPEEGAVNSAVHLKEYSWVIVTYCSWHKTHGCPLYEKSIRIKGILVFFSQFRLINLIMVCKYCLLAN